MKPIRYAIIVEGHLGAAAKAAFAGLAITPRTSGQTTLEGDLDQAGLFGILLQVQALALELVAVHRAVPHGTDA